VKCGEKSSPTETSRAAQAEHLRRLNVIDFYPCPPFTNMDNLAVQVLKSVVLEAAFGDPGLLATIIRAAAFAKPRNLPFVSLGPMFAGRADALEDLYKALLGAKGSAVVVNGLGGVGKTRLTVEYALAHEADDSALLFV
jgi:hypothetical protein